MSLHKAIDEIKGAARRSGTTGTVTVGTFMSVEQMKQATYPILHIIPTPGSIGRKKNRHGFKIMLLDQPSGRQLDPKGGDIMDPTHGTDDEQNILASLHHHLDRMLLDLRRGAAKGNGVYIGQDEDVPADPFQTEYGGVLSGYAIEIEATVDAASITQGDGSC